MVFRFQFHFGAFLIFANERERRSQWVDVVSFQPSRMKFFFSFSATFFLPDEFLFILPQFCKLYLCYSIYVNAAGKMARIIFVIASCCFFVCVCPNDAGSNRIPQRHKVLYYYRAHIEISNCSFYFNRSKNGTFIQRRWMIFINTVFTSKVEQKNWNGNWNSIKCNDLRDHAIDQACLHVCVFFIKEKRHFSHLLDVLLGI